MKIHLLKKNEIVLDRAILSKIKLADQYLTDQFHVDAKRLMQHEVQKTPLRSEIINFVLQKFNKKTCYLEIGVRHRQENFDLINSEEKYSVDPGYESEINNVDFKLTSDDFFDGLRKNKFLNPNIRFDVIFIDGSHLAEQVLKDIDNSLEFLAENGLIIMHDCNPPTEFHASENYYYRLSPSEGYWNGTTWKAFFKTRKRTDVFSCCIDTDWGIGVISKNKNLGAPTSVNNEFYEYHVFSEHRKNSLNLISFDKFKTLF